MREAANEGEPIERVRALLGIMHEASVHPWTVRHELGRLIATMNGKPVSGDIIDPPDRRFLPSPSGPGRQRRMSPPATGKTYRMRSPMAPSRSSIAGQHPEPARTKVSPTSQAVPAGRRVSFRGATLDMNSIQPSQ